jgi:hypothetical protein
MKRLSGPAHAESIGDTIDVVEPGSDQRDLKNSAVVETHGAESGVICGRALGGVFGQLHDVIEHDAVLIGDGRGLVVFLQRIDHFFVERDATQKLCVGFDSIVAAVGYGNHGGDHFMLFAG